jgi:hypothetical protein
MKSVFCACVLALVLSGCAGYQLGPTNGQPAGARSIQIEPIVNKTFIPRLGDYVNNSLRKQLQQDGTYRLETHDDGDIIVSGVITDYQRKELSFQPQDVITVLDYEITVTAQITARERATGKILFDRPVKGRTEIRAGTDLTDTERQAAPLLANDLAKKTTALLVDGTW